MKDWEVELTWEPEIVRCCVCGEPAEIEISGDYYCELHAHLIEEDLD